MKKSSLRRISALILTLVMVFALAACGAKAPAATTPAEPAAPAEPAEPAEPAAPAEPAETYELNLSMHDAAVTLKGQYMQEWADNLKSATNGALDITVFAGGALASADTVVEAMETGACDIAMVFSTYYDAIFTLTNGYSLPMIGIKDTLQGTNVLWDMYEQMPEVAAEFDDYVLIHMYSNPVSYFHFATQPVNTLEAFQGMKIRSSGGNLTNFVTACGGVPMNITTSETYEALQKNMVDGAISNGSQMVSWNLQEVTDYFMDMPVYTGVWMTLMNKDKFESLPVELQDALTATGGREGSLVLAQYLQDESNSGYETGLAAGNEWVSVSEEEQQKFYECAMENNNSWIEKNNGQAYYDKLMECVEVRS